MKTTGVRNRVYQDCFDGNYDDLQVYEWKTTFGGNIIYGVAKASTKIGNNNDNAWNNASSNWSASYTELGNTSGDQCWCQVTGYKPNNDTTIYRPQTPGPWIFTQNATAKLCPMWCSAYFISYPVFRQLLLGQSNS